MKKSSQNWFARVRHQHTPATDAHRQLMSSRVDISRITRHSEVVTRWSRHTVNSSQKWKKTRQWTRHLWPVYRVTSSLAPSPVTHLGWCQVF